MTKPLEFFFDYTCPYAYLASTQIEGVALRTGRELQWRPMLLGGVFRAREVPQVLFKTLSPSKAHHNFADMHRWADYWNVPLEMPSGHPFRSVEALRATLASPVERRPALIHAMYRAYWVDQRDISERSVIRDVLNSVGLHDVSEGPFPDTIKEDLKKETDEAIQRGVFGAPATFIGDELYWGQDRLPMLERRLGGKFPLPEVPLDRAPAKEVEFFFDVSSPFAYLASTQIERWEREWGVPIRWRPLFLGGLFTSLGGPPVPLKTFSDAKREWIGEDIQRWATHWKVPFSWPTTFPRMTVRPMRMLLALGDGCAPLALRIFKAYWEEDRDIASTDVLRELVREVGLPDSTLQAAADPQWKDALKEATESAKQLGVFGVPTFRIGDHLIWGQDRAEFVRAAARGWALPGGTPAHSRQ